MIKILSSAPTRISLIGGGGDIASFSDNYGGFCVNLAINLYSRVHITTDSSGIFNQYPLYCHPLLFDTLLGDRSGLHVVSTGDAKLGCGLGTSASSAIALLAALTKLEGEKIDTYELAEKAYKAENDIGWLTGRQDAYCASFGGMNGWEFPLKKLGDEMWKAKQHQIQRENVDRVFPYLLLTLIPGVHKNHNQQEPFTHLLPYQIELLGQLRSLAWEGYHAIETQDFPLLFKLLQTAWELKKKINNNVSNKEIDSYYEKGMNHGALAGKLLGSGGGGYFLWFIEPNKRQQFIETMNIKEVDCMPDFTGISCRIIS